MSYQPQVQDELFNEQAKELNKKLEICKEVADVVAMPGWKNTLEPILDRMIVDIVGGKLNGVWFTGKLDRAKKEERREFYIGAKQALIEFTQRINAHTQQVKILEEQIKSLNATRDVGYKMPMQDSMYNVEE